MQGNLNLTLIPRIKKSGAHTPRPRPPSGLNKLMNKEEEYSVYAEINKIKVGK